MQNPDFNTENDKIFKYFVDRVGPANYEIFYPDTAMPVIEVHPSFRALYTCCSTSASLDINAVIYRGLELAPSAPIVVIRNMRYCEHDGNPHFNSDDSVFFAHKSGRIGKVIRKDAEDHYKKISAFGETFLRKEQRVKATLSSTQKTVNIKALKAPFRTASFL